MDWKECATLDSKLQQSYANAGYEENQQFSREQAMGILNSMRNTYPEMRSLYDDPSTMLDAAQEAGMTGFGSWNNSLFDQAHPGELP